MNLRSLPVAILVIGLVQITINANAQQGMGVGNNNPLEMLDVSGAIKVGTTSAVPPGGAGTIRWNGSNFQGWDGSQWVNFGGGGTAWNLTGNSGTNPATNFIGTTDAQDFVIKRFNDEGLRLAAGGALWASGNTGTGVTPTSGAGTRMMWIPGKNAFRAGIVTGTQWDNANIGRSSAAFGEDNIASGVESFASGKQNTASGPGAVAFGWQNVASGTNSAALGGQQNTASGFASMAINISTASGQYAFSANQQNIASGKSSSVFGWVNTAPSFAEVVVGTCATNYTPASTTVYNAGDRIFNVGNGASSGARSDAFTVLKNGNVGVGTATPAQKLDVAGKIQMQTGATTGYVPVSDASGTMTWTNPATLTITETDPQVSSATTNYVPKWNGTTLVDGVMYDNGSNVGIGTTTPTYDLDIYKNEILVDQRIYANDALGIGHLLTGANGGGVINLIANSSASTFLGIPVGLSGIATDYTNMVFATGTGGTATEKMRLTTGGNLGIGTTNPSQKLQVQVANNGLNLPLLLRNSDNTAGGNAVGIGFINETTGDWAKAAIVNERTNSWARGSLHFLVDNSADNSPADLSDTKMTITAAGNVGIGTTAPSEKLDVNGKIRMQTGAAIGYIPVSDVNGVMTWTNLATSTSTYLDEIRDADNNTKIQVEESANEDKIRFDMDGTEYLVMTAGRLNVMNTGGSTFLGQEAGLVDDLSPNYNTFLGYFNGRANTTGDHNVGVGAGSLEKNISGAGNTAAGRLAMHNITSGGDNAAFGRQALYGNTNGSRNSALGAFAGNGNTGSGNIFIGYGAGNSETGNDKLYIDNSITSSPLIWGDFSSNFVNINGNLGVGNATPSEKLDVNGKIRMQTGAVAGYVPVSNGTGVMTWTNPATLPAANDGDWTISGSDQYSAVSGNVGIGVTVPLQKLDVNGQIRMQNGAVAGYVPVSDGSGTMTWTNPTALTITETDPQVSSTTANYIPKWNGSALVEGFSMTTEPMLE